jgi:single-strand DNA-binding protein
MTRCTRKGLAKKMSQDNQITLRGYLTSEPKFRQTAQSATPMTEIRLGSTPRRLNRETGEWQDQPTSYYTVKCWRRLAINASSSLHKGDMVVVRGRFQMRTWLDNQQRQRSVVEVEADSLGHDLSFGWSHFLRGSRPLPAGGPAAINAGELARQDLGEQYGTDGEFLAEDDPEEFSDGTFAPGGPADLDYAEATDELAAPLGRPAADGADGLPEGMDAPVLSDTRSDVVGPDVESASF